MRMADIWRCLAFEYVQPIPFPLVFREDPKNTKVGSPDYSRIV